jgi:hypothetical protein
MSSSRNPILKPSTLVGVAALLAPAAYLYGRYSSPGLTLLGLGALCGIPVGLFFGAMRGAITSPTATPINTPAVEGALLDEITAELNENKALFEARKGSATLVARLAYVTSFWESAKASGRLFVMQDPHLMSVISLAYYWLDQANHLETLAYDAKNAGTSADSQFTTAKLISEVRLLDGSIEMAINNALNAIAKARV